MKFDEYISNPMGRKNAVFGNREMYRELYNDKLDTIMVRELGKIDYTLYTKKSEYYIHFKIPSEVVPNFYYDTVIMFYTNNMVYSVDRTLKHYDVKFYSNDPSFVYTFAHAFLENDLFIKDLVPRMSKEAILKVATEKNPRNEVGYVKSIYFAYLLCNRLGLFNKIKFEIGSKPYNKRTLIQDIEHADTKIESRKIKGEELRVKNKKEKNSKKEELRKDIGRIKYNPDIQVSQTSSVSKVTKSSSAKKAKTSKRI